jgi:hypothetical protein
MGPASLEYVAVMDDYSGGLVGAGRRHDLALSAAAYCAIT